MEGKNQSQAQNDSLRYWILIIILVYPVIAPLFSPRLMKVAVPSRSRFGLFVLYSGGFEPSGISSTHSSSERGSVCLSDVVSGRVDLIAGVLSYPHHVGLLTQQSQSPYELRDIFSKRLISRSRLRRDSRMIQNRPLS